MNYRIGFGYDIHRLVEGRKLLIGGVQIPYVKGLLGHSDGDVLLHAVCDALFGAMSEGDIGEHFPDTDPAYAAIDSRGLLKKTVALVKKNNFSIVNLDLVIVAQEPILSPFKDRIRKSIAGLLSVKDDCVGVKAKRNEGLGEIGRKEAIASYAVVLLTKGV